MGYSQEPTSIDLLVGPSVLTEETKQLISTAVAAYRATHPRIEEVSVEEAYQTHVLGAEQATSAA